MGSLLAVDIQTSGTRPSVDFTGLSAGEFLAAVVALALLLAVAVPYWLLARSASGPTKRGWKIGGCICACLYFIGWLLTAVSLLIRLGNGRVLIPADEYPTTGYAGGMLMTAALLVVLLAHLLTVVWLLRWPHLVLAWSIGAIMAYGILIFALSTVSGIYYSAAASTLSALLAAAHYGGPMLFLLGPLAALPLVLPWGQCAAGDSSEPSETGDANEHSST